MPLGSKLAAPRESQIRNIGTKKENMKILLLRNKKVHSFDIWYVASPNGSYQDCSYDAPGVKTGPAWGVRSLKHRNKEGKLSNSFSLKLEGAEL